MLEAEAERNMVGSFRFGARFEDARTMDMALDVSKCCQSCGKKEEYESHT